MLEVDLLRVRKILGRKQWSAPEPLLPYVWGLKHLDGDGSVLVSAALWDDVVWIHASMTRRGRVPDYDDLCRLHRAVFGDRWAYHVFAPPEAHVNEHEYALHLWGRTDGRNALPDFGATGTI
ncbi:hypothetical protein [Amycolatopsis sp. CA-128772]|uniref:DUF7694 domain-containing protein n=1 Tax=Amycolatopsis sp. CA-128772 TaxID=2073159 RepID=UPI0011B0BEDD|nr:hypothetical protein [Amycolatopsis sp. CA-128772]